MYLGRVAQGLEHVATNYGVGGSNPSLPELFADVAELVDARDLGSRVFGVRVRVSPSVNI